MQQKLNSDRLSVTINSFGAELCSVKDPDQTEFIWQANKEVWARHSPVLFPIVGKLVANKFNYKGQDYELLQHGFARDMEFELLSSGPVSCLFQLSSSPQTEVRYPFEFTFRIRYELSGSTLTTNYQVINTSVTEDLLFSVGAHPGFNCPLLPGEEFEDYYLEFEKESYQLTKLADGLRSSETRELVLRDRKLFLSEELFGNDALVFEGGQIDKVSLCSNRSSHKVTLNCNDWPYFGIWAKKGCKQFVCLEPWNGIADHQHAQPLEHKEGILRLEPRAQFDRSFSITFS